MGVKLHRVARFDGVRAGALNVGHADGPARIVERDGSREPAYGDEALELGFSWREIDYCHGVLGAVANEERFARAIEGQGVGAGAEEVGRVLPGPDGFDDLIAAGVDDAQ